eukprot:TRINITY_DN45720_c0_g1_i1.p1 TRINITY_DN45720_c0_g1~~TRINITY_DN45720_c0_g1_i1.p1  ORF type:complete len:162 (+),score=58.47 TRINITY_DN45720_c0_g1_i1:28-513(+)
MDKNGQKPEKKPFDKKAYRKKKYDKSVKMDIWKSKRENYLKHKFQKMQKKEGNVFDVKKIYEENTAENESKNNDRRTKSDIKPFKKSSLSKAHEAFKNQKALKEKKQAEFQQRMLEKEEKMKLYKEKKNKRGKVMGAKNKRGQPLMGGRIELLLEKIQKGM